MSRTSLSYICFSDVGRGKVEAKMEEKWYVDFTCKNSAINSCGSIMVILRCVLDVRSSRRYSALSRGLLRMFLRRS